jgi:acyl-CoA thioesterase I
VTAPSLFGAGLPFVLDHSDPPPPPPVRPRVAVYGDSYSCTRGAEGPLGWPALVSAALGVETVVMAVGGSGYVKPGNDTGPWSTFSYAATINPVPNAAAVVVMGSQNDQNADPVAVRLAALTAYGAEGIRPARPHLLVVGPFWPYDPPPANLLAVRDSVRAAAIAAGAVFLDPLGERWLTSGPGLVLDGDGWHPSLAGQRMIADRIAPALRVVLTT